MLLQPQSFHFISDILCIHNNDYLYSSSKPKYSMYGSDARRGGSHRTIGRNHSSLAFNSQQSYTVQFNICGAAFTDISSAGAGTVLLLRQPKVEDT